MTENFFQTNKVKKINAARNPTNLAKCYFMFYEIQIFSFRFFSFLPGCEKTSFDIFYSFSFFFNGRVKTRAKRIQEVCTENKFLVCCLDFYQIFQFIYFLIQKAPIENIIFIFFQASIKSRADSGVAFYANQIMPFIQKFSSSFIHRALYYYFPGFKAAPDAQVVFVSFSFSLSFAPANMNIFLFAVSSRKRALRGIMRLEFK